MNYLIASLVTVSLAVLGVYACFKGHPVAVQIQFDERIKELKGTIEQ